MEVTTELVDKLSMPLTHARLLRIFRTVQARHDPNSPVQQMMQELITGVLDDMGSFDLRNELIGELSHATPKELAVMRSALLAERTPKT